MYFHISLTLCTTQSCPSVLILDGRLELPELVITEWSMVQIIGQNSTIMSSVTNCGVLSITPNVSLTVNGMFSPILG